MKDWQNIFKSDDETEYKGYKYLKSERKTFKISLENKSCTCVRFEKFAMCHHLVAVALAEGKELR